MSFGVSRRCLGFRLVLRCVVLCLGCGGLPCVGVSLVGVCLWLGFGSGFVSGLVVGLFFCREYW